MITRRSPVSAPTMRPVLARTSSAASGLRFCGIIEEPVVNLSDSRIRPVSGDDQITISSAKRDRCTAAIAQADSVSSTKSRSATASSEFAIGRAKPSAFAVMARSIGNDVPASAPAPSGLSLSRAPRVGEAAAVARRPSRHRRADDGRTSPAGPAADG